MVKSNKRRYHRTKEQHLALSASVRRALQTSRTCKEVADDHDISLSWLYRIARDQGFSSMLVSENERRAIIVSRELLKS